ncbi:hypothetical protein EDC04DRAFT_2608003 [Pisolithus marmoratus]|nr:hypothetical protein EDC04DRAFT_2608003 [Pisolithus marmoratus]
MPKGSTSRGITMIGPTPGHRVKQLQVKKQKANGRYRSRLVEVRSKESNSTSHDCISPSSSPSKNSRFSSKHQFSECEDGLDLEYNVHETPDKPLQAPHKKTQNDYIQEWLPQKEEFLRIILEMEAPPEPRICSRYRQSRTNSGHKTPKDVPMHPQLDGQDWEDAEDILLNLQLPIGSKYLTIVDVTGIHYMLLCAKLWPSTFQQPRTAFTFAVLDDFLRDNLECGTSAMNYFSKLWQITSRLFPHLVPDRYRELLRDAQKWQLIKLCKWNAFRTKNKSANKGDLALFCVACLQPGINVDTNESLDHWKYSHTMVMDGNFKVEHMQEQRPEDQATPHVTETAGSLIAQESVQQLVLGMGVFTPIQWHLNMDYSLANAMGYSMAGIRDVICFYDINCSYMKNLQKWLGGSSLIQIPSSIQIVPGISIWHMNDSNFMKMIRLADSLCQKLKTARASVALAWMAFTQLDATISPTSRQLWKSQEEATLEQQVDDCTVMDHPLCMVLNFSNCSHMKAAKCHMVENTTEVKKLAMACHADQLATKRSTFVADAAIYIGQHVATNMQDNTNSAAHDVGWDSLVWSEEEDGEISMDEMAALPWSSRDPLPMPSMLLRLVLVDKAVIFCSVVWPARNYSMKTHTWAMIHTVDKSVRKQAMVYQTCCKAMVALGAGSKILSCYQEWQKSHLTINTAAFQQNELCHCQDHLPWFWSIDIPKDMESRSWMSEFYWIHWLRAKAVQDHWEEEEELLISEFQWPVNFFKHHVGCASVSIFT